MKVLILAGGGGTRLWPLSRKDFPKQFLRFNDPLSLLQKTVKRFLMPSFVDDVVVLTNIHHQKLVEQQLAEIDTENSVQVLVEPTRRNTCPAIALGVKYLEEKMGCQPDEVVLVIPSDHFLDPETVFFRALEEIEPFVKDGQWVLFGIKPDKPETGYGYIQIGEKKRGSLCRVKRFVEKPDLHKAEEYLRSGDYYWNAGIFAFNPKTFWKEIEIQAPDIFSLMSPNFENCLECFDRHPNLSIDYAVLEKTESAVVYPLPINWSDIGCWDSVYDVFEKDLNQNVKQGNVLDIETNNSLIIGGKKLISTIGLQDMIIIDTEEAIFITKKGESQKVKGLVEALYRNNLKNRNFDKEPPQNFCPERAIIAERQGASEDKNFEEKATQSKTDSSGCFDINRNNLKNQNFDSEEAQQSSANWGNVKLLYKSPGLQIHCYEIKPLQSCTFSVPVNTSTTWISSKGAVLINGKKLRALESFSCEDSGQKVIENFTENSAQLLIIQISSVEQGA